MCHFERTGNLVADRKTSRELQLSSGLPISSFSSHAYELSDYKKKSLTLPAHWEDEYWPVWLEGDDQYGG